MERGADARSEIVGYLVGAVGLLRSEPLDLLLEPRDLLVYVPGVHGSSLFLSVSALASSSCDAWLDLVAAGYLFVYGDFLNRGRWRREPVVWLVGRLQWQQVAPTRPGRST